MVVVVQSLSCVRHNPVGCSIPGFLVLHYILEFAQTHIHWVGWRCYPTISSSVVPFYFCLQSFPASVSFPMSQLSASFGQSIGVSASATASVLTMNIQGWFLLRLTGLISLQSVVRQVSFCFCFIISGTHLKSGLHISVARCPHSGEPCVSQNSLMTLPTDFLRSNFWKLSKIETRLTDSGQFICSWKLLPDSGNITFFLHS